MTWATFATWAGERAARLQTPSSLLYWPYVVSALVITVGAMHLAGTPLRDALRVVASRKVWLCRSTRTDVAMTLAHELFVFVPTVAFGAHVSSSVLTLLKTHALGAGAGAGLGWAPPVAVQSVLVTVLVMLAIDLGTFIAHRLHHEVPFLWDMHAVHHSAEQLTFFTAHRVHPAEAVLRAAIQGVLSGLVLFAVKAAFGQVAPVVRLGGLGAGFFLHMFTNNLLHQHVPVHYPKWLRSLVLSPHIHHLHHSRLARHHDRNFGAMFPYWDKICGTYLDEEIARGELTFGLDRAEDPFRHSVARCYVYPFVVPFQRLLQRLRRAHGAPSR